MVESKNDYIAAPTSDCEPVAVAEAVVNEHTAEEASSGDTVSAVVWALFLLFLVWPAAGFVTGIWCVLQPLECLLPIIRDINQRLFGIMTWPRIVGLAIRDSSKTLPLPDFDQPIDPEEESEQDNGNIVASILWLLLLLYVAWPLAMFVTGFWLTVQPFEAFIDVPMVYIETVENVTTWPRQLGFAIKSGQRSFPSPFK